MTTCSEDHKFPQVYFICFLFFGPIFKFFFQLCCHCYAPTIFSPLSLPNFLAPVVPEDCVDCPHKMNFLPLSFFLSEVSFMVWWIDGETDRDRCGERKARIHWWINEWAVYSSFFFVYFPKRKLYLCKFCTSVIKKNGREDEDEDELRCTRLVSVFLALMKQTVGSVSLFYCPLFLSLSMTLLL